MLPEKKRVEICINGWSGKWQPYIESAIAFSDEEIARIPSFECPVKNYFSVWMEPEIVTLNILFFAVMYLCRMFSFSPQKKEDQFMY